MKSRLPKMTIVAVKGREGCRIGQNLKRGTEYLKRIASETKIKKRGLYKCRMEKPTPHRALLVGDKSKMKVWWLKSGPRAPMLRHVGFVVEQKIGVWQCVRNSFTLTLLHVDRSSLDAPDGGVASWFGIVTEKGSSKNLSTGRRFDGGRGFWSFQRWNIITRWVVETKNLAKP